MITTKKQDTTHPITIYALAGIGIVIAGIFAFSEWIGVDFRTGVIVLFLLLLTLAGCGANLFYNSKVSWKIAMPSALLLLWIATCFIINYRATHTELDFKVNYSTPFYANGWLQWSVGIIIFLIPFWLYRNKMKEAPEIIENIFNR